jgi:hypothetical protein
VAGREPRVRTAVHSKIKFNGVCGTQTTSAQCIRRPEQHGLAKATRPPKSGVPIVMMKKFGQPTNIALVDHHGYGAMKSFSQLLDPSESPVIRLPARSLWMRQTLCRFFETDLLPEPTVFVGRKTRS